MPIRDPASVHGEYGSATQELRQVRQVRENITRVYPEATPFFTMLNRTATVSDGRANKYEWQILSEFPRVVTLTEASTAADVTLDVESANHVTESQLLLDPVTKEQLLVISKSGTTLTVATRGSVGGGAAGALAAGKNLYLLGVAREEGDTRLAAMGITPSFDHNFFQQFELVHGITDRAEQIMYYGPNQRDLDAMEVMSEYKKRIERQFLFGYRKKIEAGSSGAVTHPRWMMGGMLDYIEQANNIFDAGGAFTYQEMCRFMIDQVRAGGGNTFFGQASLEVLNIINEWGLSHHQADHMRTKEYGLEITRIKGPGWVLNLTRNEQFEEQDEIRTWLMITNPRHVRHHVMRGLGDRNNRNITGPKNDGDHTKRDQITGTHTLEVSLPEAHSIIANITA